MTVASSQSQFQAQMRHAPDPIVSERQAIEHALMRSAQALERLQHKRKRGAGEVSDDGALEEPLTKCIRLNLLALAKRAPLDKIIPPPAELVPESIRGMVPTAWPFPYLARATLLSKVASSAGPPHYLP
ncbi:hypothetical protein F5141DRAFT_1080528, partial [Pisolithus sp. B1]